jgi:predicted dehydrogenase
VVRVALIGYGLAGAAFHAPLIETVDGLELAAIVTRNPERRAAAAGTHPGAELLESADEVMARAGDFGLVVVASPNSTHVPLARAAIEAGLPVVVDKPLAASTAQARPLIELARERGVMLTVFQNRRWDGDFLTARALIEGGDLGPVHRFESRFERWRPEIKAGWREEDPDKAGGVLYDLGSHLVDQALQLFGPARDVYGEVDVRRPGATVDDDAFVAITHASGVRSHLWMSATAAQLGPRLRVLGGQGAYVKYGLDPQEDALRAGRTPAEPHWGEEPEAAWGLVGSDDDPRPLRTEAGAYQHFYEGVERALRDGAEPPVDPADAVAALEVLETVRSGSR